MNGERTSEHFARDTDPGWRRALGQLRRMVVRFARKGLWELGGFSKLDERLPQAEVFQGLGIWAVPAGDVEVEAVVVNIGGADHPVVVALRDEKTRKAVGDALAGDTTCLHNTISRLVLLPDGTIEARTHGGTAQRLALYSDVEALRTFDTTHTHPVATTGTAAAQTGTAAASATTPATLVGTTKLKGE